MLILSLHTRSDKFAKVYLLDDIASVSRGKEKENDCSKEEAVCQFEARGHSGLVGCLTFSPSGEFVASGCDKGTVNIWSILVREFLDDIVTGSLCQVLLLAFL